MSKRIFISIVAAVLVLAALTLFIASYYLEEPLRRSMERNINAALKGYEVRIHALNLHLYTLSLDLNDLVIRQDKHPEPPIVEIPKLHASVDWRALLYLKLVAEFEIFRPTFYLNLTQLRSEQQDNVSLAQKGWQQAVKEIYPLKVNHLAIRNGEVTYVDNNQFRPLRLTNIVFEAANIRNIKADHDKYPSTFRISAKVFDAGFLDASGNADFLAEPNVAIKSKISCKSIDLTFFNPITRHAKISLKSGHLSTDGKLEYSANHLTLIVPTLQISRLHADYTHVGNTTPTTKLSRKTAKLVKKSTHDNSLEIDFGSVRITNSNIGVVNRNRSPHYRIFLSEASLTISNLGNQVKSGMATGKLIGNFMGSGRTHVTAFFTPRDKSADFDIKLAIEKTNLTDMNDILRGYANVDVSAGKFSFYSEINGRLGRIEGYVKPLFQDVDVYDPRKDANKQIFQQFYEGVADGLSWVLENNSRNEVATKTRISGNLSNPETNALQVVIGLVQNAFFKAILPGFERAAK